ncbi:hypothetical protein PR202_ga02780 [Eleusine coracana subsp. coracana]|uniref:Uncharacterized protein n=1 Tax=Eleusine coracana subsp. coracana TaxID=191504 RepID=A0AAV5BKE4_ELECO|nr:hypothetical protein PR202_ga02780 [Eleusine coracana subsp. coracana]
MSRVGAEHVTPGAASLSAYRNRGILAVSANPRRVASASGRRTAILGGGDKSPHHSSLIASRHAIRHFGMPNSLRLLHRMVWPSVLCPLLLMPATVPSNSQLLLVVSSPAPSNPHAHAALSSPALLQVSSPATSIAATRYCFPSTSSFAFASDLEQLWHFFIASLQVGAIV